MGCWQILVSGHVQGVGFRNFAYRCAVDFGVTGWVRNLRDGRVEIMARGTDDQVIDFVKKVRVGPRYCHVAKLEQVKIGLTDVETRFTIKDDEEMPWAARS